MSKLYFNPNTYKQINTYLNKPAHSVVLSGQNGSGKTTAALYIAEQLLGRSPVKHEYFKHIQTVEKGGIDEVREIKKHLTRTTVGEETIRRVVILEKVERLSHEAQNALLKTLEEPPKDTVIILTCANSGQLLSTILSRARLITILPLTTSQSKEIISDSGKEYQKQDLLSKNLAGSLLLLLSSDDHQEPLNNAKEFLKQTPYQRLSQVDEYAKNKEKLSELLENLEIILYATMISASSNKINMFHSRLERVIKAKQQLKANVNNKLVISSLATYL